ncbi:MAG: efflux RND transporter periplasmic adaptor subunit [Proteobacteria bacterium]|nr:efflux RND transporter periplasmic adaptor subunit [Pseudomonadota bacterium]
MKALDVMKSLRQDKRLLLGLTAVVALAAAMFFFAGGNGNNGIYYETVIVDRGPIRSVVTATGAVRPLVVVEIGSQLSGQIAELYVDYNDPVSQGQLIARIDPQTFETRVRQSEADVAVAMANIAERKAGVLRVENDLGKAERDLERIDALAARGNASDATLDAAQTAVDNAKTDLASAKAQLQNAEATVLQRQAGLEQARIDLGRTEIRSPVDGIVIERSVDIGQIVAASLSAPVLFQIAQDLSQIQVEASVDEADIGSVKAGDPVIFNVDAHPDIQFSGEIDIVRLAAIELQNVVTYTVVVSAQNPDRRLLPGMTANVEITTGEREDVIRVNNSVFRFNPGIEVPENLGQQRGQGGDNSRRGNNAGSGGQFDQIMDGLGLTSEQRDQISQRLGERRQRNQGRQGRRSESGPGERRGDNADRQSRRRQRQDAYERLLADILSEDQMAQYRSAIRATRDIRRAVVWTPSEDGPVPVPVRLGITDTHNTEVIGGLEEGDEIIYRQRRVPK